MLQQEADKWEPNQNSYVQAIKQLSENMKILSRFGKEPHSHMVSEFPDSYKHSDCP